MNLQETSSLVRYQAMPPNSNDILEKFRNLWWTDGNIHPSANWDEASLPYLLKSDVDWEKYSERTDMYNVHGRWEWINGNVCSRAIEGRVRLADSQEELISSGSTCTKAGNKGKEADGSFLPFDKPDLNSNGREGPNSLLPWPNLVIEVASLESEAHLLNAVKDYWLCPGRAHDAIAVKLIRSDTIISKLKVWHFCNDKRTQSGELIPVSEFEFETIDDKGKFLIQPQQHTIDLKIKCLFHGMPPTFQIPTSISDPLIIDFYYVLRSMKNVLKVS
ncbi:10898_t:CDS:2 [Funneliformis mosseae]|uniref:10898_t:CDS:1 n=1 Tax=Funneliformis mosseae TaxID=27381 RepID=A0A9N9CQE7_FUNMO|nr:10898_t:CDS:2 [Funneliformis mosseae]